MIKLPGLLLYLSCFTCIVFFTSCARKNTLFKKLSPEHSGIHFSNQIHDTDSSSSFINEFGYMGGGVGIGDFNNDGLKDIFFSANQSTCRLYINQGDLKFEDVTGMAGLGTNVWATGVCVADVNADGYDDIYICTYGKNLAERSSNLLFINQHNLTFKEEAAAYGLADTAYSSQAAFLDYDNDGDLDMYLANYAFNHTNSSANNIIRIDTSGNAIANDRLYRNDGDINQSGHPVFTDVSFAAGIKEDGYGLGVCVTDINNDGWPDIYVANDFITNDRLWLNNRDGTFKDIIDKSLRHQSYSSMGVDAADINNDGWQDICTLDMLPELNERRKTSHFFMNYDRYRAERFMGYAPEFMRNMLQLNNGNRPDVDNLPFFSEIGQLSGIAATDWSWSVLLADFDLDGLKDAHITNGVGRDFINADFLEFSSNIAGTNIDEAKRQKAIREKLARLDHVRLPNYYYRNNGGLRFEDISALAGITDASMSNGAAYADLDNDGDLDIIVNNIDDDAFVFINEARNTASDTANHYLKINFVGPQQNRHAIGAKLLLYQGSKVQSLEQQPVRGYYSTVDNDLVFGLGANTTVDSLRVIWPNGNTQLFRHPAIDSTIVLDYKNSAVEDFRLEQTTGLNEYFTPYNNAALATYQHNEVEFNDFAAQRLLPQKYSQLGPFIASDDVNGDGLTDFFVSGAARQDGSLFINSSTGEFTRTDLPTAGAADQLNCIFLDADRDGDKDLVITYGDLQAPANAPEHRPKLFLNDGHGSFSEALNAFAEDVACIAGTLTAADYDGDGDMDLFIGARVSDKYPIIPRSFLLRNDNGRFKDVTAEVCPALQYAGMLTASAWVDMDRDQQVDLVIAGEWMPVRIFKNDHGKLHETTGPDPLTGMWRSLKIADIDNDGDADIIAGNLGLNCLYDASPQKPMELHAADLDGNGIIDPVMFYYIKNEKGEQALYPAIARSQFSDQVPAIKKKFLLAKDYASAGYQDIFKAFGKKDTVSLNCEETNTCIFENLGNGKFAKHALPVEAQFAPVNAITCADLDGDGINDLLLAGNEYQTDVITGRYDASYGCFLKGDGHGGFKYLPARSTGFMVDGDVKDMCWMPGMLGNGLLIVAANNAPLQLFRHLARR